MKMNSIHPAWFLVPLVMGEAWFRDPTVAYCFAASSLPVVFIQGDAFVSFWYSVLLLVAIGDRLGVEFCVPNISACMYRLYEPNYVAVIFGSLLGAAFSVKYWRADWADETDRTDG